jgi:hypothetical protein
MIIYFPILPFFLKERYVSFFDCIVYLDSVFVNGYNEIFDRIPFLKKLFHQRKLQQMKIKEGQLLP